jgi:hypothetical protein
MLNIVKIMFLTRSIPAKVKTIHYLFFIILFFSLTAKSQGNSVIWVDMVKVKNGRYLESTYFFENNWKVYRDSAIKKGYIKSYKLLKNLSDSATLDFMLITEYSNMQSFEKREAFFQLIIKAIRPNGPIFLNTLKRDDILTITSGFLMESIHNAE